MIIISYNYLYDLANPRTRLGSEAAALARGGRQAAPCLLAGRPAGRGTPQSGAALCPGAQLHRDRHARRALRRVSRVPPDLDNAAPGYELAGARGRPQGHPHRPGARPPAYAGALTLHRQIPDRPAAGFSTGHRRGRQCPAEDAGRAS